MHSWSSEEFIVPGAERIGEKVRGHEVRGQRSEVVEV